MTAPTKALPPVPTKRKPPQRPAPPTPIEQALVKRGLARAGVTPKEGGGPVTQKGLLREDEAEHEYTRDEKTGDITGTKDSDKHSRGAGVKSKVEGEHDRFDGVTKTTAKGEATGLAGAEAAVEIVKTATTEEVKWALEAMARAGAFGEAKGQAAYRRGRAKASASGEASGGAGAQTEVKMAATVNRKGLIPALEAVIEAGFKVGIWGEAKGEAMAGYGPATIKIIGEIKAFAGASGEFSAKAFFSAKEGIGGSFTASAFAGLSTEGKGSVELKLGPGALLVQGEFSAMAGAKAEASGNFSVSLKGVEAKFAAEGFAGAKASASGSATLKIMGKKILYAKGEVEVSAGAGGTIKGEFVIKDGKIKIMGALAGTLGVGMGASADSEIDFGALATVVIAKVGEISSEEGNEAIPEHSPDYERKELTGDEAVKKEKAGYDAVFEDFSAAAASLDRDAKGVLTQDRIQAVISERAPLLRAQLAYREFDKGMERAAQEAFAGRLKSIVINAGRIRGFQATSAVDLAQHTKSNAWLAAHDKLRKDLDAYALKKAGSSSANGIKKDKVQGVISAHYPKLVAAFGDGQADEIVRLATKGVANLTDGFLVTGGQIRMFVVSEAKAQGAKDAKVKTAADATRAAAVAAFERDLTALRGRLVAKLGATLSTADLQKLVTTAASKAKGSAPAVVDAALAGAISKVFDGVVDYVVVSDGRVVTLDVKHNGLITARAAKAEGDRDKARDDAVEAFGTSMKGYLESATGKVGSELATAKVQKNLDNATRKVTEWAKTDDAATRLTGAAQAALPSMITAMKIEKGVITTFTPDLGALKAAQEFRSKNGRKRVEGGEEDDNARRRMVADALRTELGSYATKITSSAKTKTPLKPTKEQLQKILDSKLKTIRADAMNDAGDAAVVTAIKSAFGSLVKDVVVKDLKVVSLTTENDLAAIVKKRQDASNAVRQATDDLAADVKQMRVPTKANLQKLVTKHSVAFSGLPAAEADAAMMMAVFNGIGAPAIEKITIDAATVTEFELRKLVDAKVR